MIHADFDTSAFSQKQKYDLAQLVQKGFVRIEGLKAYPSFCIFTSEQYRQIEETVFKPFAAKHERETENLADDVAEQVKNKVPSQMKNYEDLFISRAFGYIGFLTTFFAFGDNKLYVPKDKRDVEFLTLMFIG